MKIGIVGDAKRAVAWEQHIRPHHIVREVQLCAHLHELEDIDACFLLNDSPYNLAQLLSSVKHGYHSFLISRMPTDASLLEKIYRASMEAGVQVLFSNWPVLAPATQFMMDRMHRPSLINISRHLQYTQFSNAEQEFRHYWIEELALCLKWMDSGIHHSEVKRVEMADNVPSFIQIFLRFDNGSAADIHLYTGAQANHHQRIATNKHEILECDVPNQHIRIGQLNSGNHLFFNKQTFDPAKAAEKAALIFLKSVQMNRESPYTAYDAYQLSLQINKLENRLSQFR